MRLLAEKAIQRDTGARALRSTIEELMIELMYRLPEEPKPGKYTITKDIIERKVDLFEGDKKKESA